MLEWQWSQGPFQSQAGQSAALCGMIPHVTACTEVGSPRVIRPPQNVDGGDFEMALAVVVVGDQGAKRLIQVRASSRDSKRAG